MGHISIPSGNHDMSRLAEGRSLPPGADALPADAEDRARLGQGEPIARSRDAAFPLLLPLLAPRPSGDHSVATELIGVLAKAHS